MSGNGSPPPEVSIVIPCFNQGDYLRECIQSVEEQALHAWEVLVVDDASTEGDPEKVVLSFGDDRVRLIRHETNRGLGAARNTGFSAARAPFILPLDADDRLAPEYLSATLAAIRGGDGADCAFTDWRIFGAYDEVRHHPAPHGLPALLAKQTIPGPGTLMARDVWERAGGYSEAAELRSGNEDWDFWIAAAVAGIHPVYIARPLYLYRRHDAQMTETSLSQEAHTQHEFMYLRHREVFSRFQEGGRFRASGYRRSIGHAWETGQRRRALALLSRGLATPGVGPVLAGMVIGIIRKRVATTLGLRRLQTE